MQAEQLRVLRDLGNEIMAAFSISIVILLFVESGLGSSVPIYSLQSTNQTDKFHIFFSTMNYFRQIGIVRAVYFLTPVIGPESPGYFLLSEAKCITNSSYCYVTLDLPECPSASPGICDWQVTLRGNKLNNSAGCDFVDCPNMDTPVDCHLTAVKDCRTAPTLPPFACQLPPELKSFRATHICPRATVGTTEQSPVLPIVVVTVGLLLCCALALTAFFISRRRAASMKYVVLVNLIDLPSEPAKVRIPYLEMPSRQDGVTAANMPQYSLESLMAVQNGHFFVHI